MTPHQASAAWQKRQAQALRQTYLKAWQTGVTNYRSQYATPPAATTAPAPTTPNATAMQRALAPALASLAQMGAYLAIIVPTAAQATAATVGEAYMLAAREYMAKNAWRLAAAISIAWAAEQHGYAQAAAHDGQLLEWQLDPDPGVHHCDDCPALAELPAMPLSMWPTLPGEGMTDCSVGCKCSMRAVSGSVLVPLTGDQQQTVARVGYRQPVLVAA